ncbi:MAG: ankyrin repeat domain-containing protein [Gammaproteobacteria bacterium]
MSLQMNLFKAIKRQSFLGVQNALLRRESVNMIDTMGFTPLHWAALKGGADIIELLINHHASPNTPGTKLNLTPLHIAVAANNSEAVAKLIELGADIHATNIKGQTALDLAILINTQGDALKLFGKHIPAATSIDALQGCFETIEILLQQGAVISEMKALHRLVLNAIARDRVSLLESVIERGFDYRSLNDDDYVWVGFDYALIFAGANCAVDCLEYLLKLNPNILVPHDKSYSGVIKRNMVSWVNQQLPEEAVFRAPYQVLQAQIEKKLVNPQEGDLKKLMPENLQNCEVDFAYDANEKKYYLSRVQYGYSFIYFDSTGQLCDQAIRLEKFEQLLRWYHAHEIDLNCYDESGNRSAQFTLHCPRSIIEIFIKHGMRYKGWDLTWAVKECSAEVIDLLIDHCPVTWRNTNGHTALDLLSSDSVRDELLNVRGGLISKIQTKQLKENLTFLSAETEAETQLSLKNLSLLVQFEKRASHQAPLTEANVTDTVTNPKPDLRM